MAASGMIPLRLRGVTAFQLLSAGVAAMPLGYLLSQLWVRPGGIQASGLLAACAAIAVLPWLSLAVARLTYRAACDDVALHVRGEALPYVAITELVVERSIRRVVLRLRRQKTVEVELVLWDAFAGRLEPFEELAARLAAAGHPVERPSRRR